AAYVESLSLGSRPPAPPGSVSSSSSSRRRGNRDLGLQYIEAMRNMGADLEELMVLEALRRSMADSGGNAEQGGQDQGQSPGDAAAHAPAAAPSDATPPIPTIAVEGVEEVAQLQE
ncbi:hypothetical protein BDK51DRAFT_26979, partial [Blyttiomyces helicus]